MSPGARVADAPTVAAGSHGGRLLSSWVRAHDAALSHPAGLILLLRARADASARARRLRLPVLRLARLGLPRACSSRSRAAARRLLDRPRPSAARPVVARAHAADVPPRVASARRRPQLHGAALLPHAPAAHPSAVRGLHPGRRAVRALAELVPPGLHVGLDVGGVVLDARCTAARARGEDLLAELRRCIRRLAIHSHSAGYDASRSPKSRGSCGRGQNADMSSACRQATRSRRERLGLASGSFATPHRRLM